MKQRIISSPLGKIQIVLKENMVVKIEFVENRVGLFPLKKYS